ncbi:hypothetical protein [Sphingomonas sp. KR3-1]|uniref:hypothetical protein n=1 Tax=Sphingomonas sp. KR3-1 TaxID=3156611 RepID=UPI0032B4E9FC
MVITIDVQNGSSVDLGISQGMLTGGSWVGASPTPGTVLGAGQSTYVNASGSTFSSAGGVIILVPASGGTINMSWSWSPGSPVIAYGLASGTSVVLLSYGVRNAQTFSPTVTYVIADAGTGLGEAAGELACPPANMV